MNNQDILREQVKMVKALNNEWSYKAMSEVLQMNVHSFYNWLHGYYSLSKEKEDVLRGLLYDLMA